MHAIWLTAVYLIYRRADRIQELIGRASTTNVTYQFRDVTRHTKHHDARTTIPGHLAHYHTE